MNTHVYTFDGEIFLQKAGGPIGLRSTCAVARITMSTWDARWRRLMKDNNIKMMAADRYMDDIRSFLKALKPGWRWLDGKLCYTASWMEEDVKEALTPTRRTANRILESMNSIMSFLRFTQEIGEDFPDLSLPSLDITVWVAENRILFKFFSKPMATNLVVQAKTALSEEVKLSTLAEEVCRRLRNTSKRLDHSRRLETLEDLSTKMSTSGHTTKFMRRAMERGIKSFTTKLKKSELEKDDPRYQPLYVGWSWKRNERKKEKIMKKNKWFRPGTEDGTDRHVQPSGRKGNPRGGNMENAQVESVIFAPSTRGGVLTRKLREREEELSRMTGFGIKFQEAGGTKMINMFNTNLGGGLHCGRKPCPPCDSNEEGKRDDCRARNLVYESVCTMCNPTSRKEEGDRNRKGIYIGETSRSIHERSKEHHKDAEDFSEKSHQVKHWMNSHPEEGTQPQFRIRIIRRYRDCLSRQVGEALRIFFSKDELLNSKSEYVQNNISRVVVNEENWERKERERREEEEEEKEKKRLESFRELKQVEKTSLQEETQPAWEPSILKVGDWIKKRRETDQLDGIRIRNHKKVKMSPPVENDDDEPPEPTGHEDDDQVVTENITGASSRVNLSGVTGGSSNEASSPTCSGRNAWLDENLQKKTLVGKEENPVVVDDGHDDGSIGGPSHQVGVGAPLQQRNSRACVPQDNIDETVQEGRKMKIGKEKLPEGRKVAKQGRKQKKVKPVMNLAWLSMWWRRMERESEKKVALEKVRKDGDKLLKYFIKKPESSNTFVKNSVGEREGGGDVLIERHPSVDEPNERHPAIASATGQGLLCRGDKRILHGEISSPAKRRKTFTKLLSYWENKTDSENPEDNNYNYDTQSEICLPGLGSNEVRSDFNTGDRDEINQEDLYMPGGGVG